MIDQNIIDVLELTRTLFAKEGLEHSTLTDGGGADTGGKNALPHGKFTFSNGVGSAHPIKRQQGQPWDNGFLYESISSTALTCNVIRHAWSFGLPTAADIAACNALEFVIESREAGMAYDMEWQCKPSKVDGPPAWRVYYPGNGKGSWVTIPGLPVPVLHPGVMISVVAYFVIDRVAKTFTHAAIVIDGKPFQVGVTNSAWLKWPGVNNAIHAVQLDPYGAGVPFNMNMKDWSIRGL